MTKSAKIFVALFLLFYSFSQAQEEEMGKSTYLAFDEIIGLENTGLLNGVEYIERNRTVNELDKYFLSQRFLEGSVFYDNQPYFEIQMKYNIWNDLLLAKIPYNQATPVMELHKSKIKSFEINSHRFINVSVENAKKDIGGFYEILFENALFKLLKKHKQKEKKILKRDFLYYEYKPDEPDYVLFYRGNYQEINSKREFSEHFPDLNREIRKFYREQRSMRKSNKDQFMTNLLLKITSLVKEPRT